eukprot:5044471-Pleurochrysis_carterae.AAC.1
MRVGRWERLFASAVKEARNLPGIIVYEDKRVLVSAVEGARERPSNVGMYESTGVRGLVTTVVVRQSRGIGFGTSIASIETSACQGRRRVSG